jgi:hypothetical protein
VSSARRRTISRCAEAASSVSVSTSSAVQLRGTMSMAQKEPIASPSTTIGTPR